MKWILIFLSLSVNNDICNSPFPLIKYADAIYDSQEECEKAFQNSKFYKKETLSQIVGFCVGPLKPMFLTPTQLNSKVEYPTCP